MKYLTRDNLVLSHSISDYNDQNPTTEIVKENNQYIIDYNNNYPNFGSIELFESTGSIVSDSTHFEIKSGAVTKIRVPIINDKIREINSKYNKKPFEFSSCKFTLFSDKSKIYDNDTKYVFEKIYNSDDEKIVDYIQDDNNLFAEENQIELWDKIYGSVQRDEYVSWINKWQPKYIFELVKDGVTSYKKIYLDKQSISNSASNYYSVKFEDLSSYTTDNMNIIRTLPMLLKCVIFEKYMVDELSKYDTVNLLFYINNVESEASLQKPIFLYKKDWLQSYNNCSAIVELKLNINNLSDIKSKYKDYILNLRLFSSDLSGYFNSEQNNIELYIDSQKCEFNYNDENYIDFNSLNYTNISSNITSYDFEYDSNSYLLIKIILKNSKNNNKFKLKNFGFTLQRKEKMFNLLKSVYSSSSMVSCIHVLDQFFVTKLPYTINNSKIISTNLITANVLYKDVSKIQGLLIDDVKKALSLIKNIDISVSYRNINNQDSLFYIKFIFDDTIQYLRKFLDNDIINNIINNMSISINTILSTGTLSKELVSLESSDLVTSYISDKNIIYMFKYTSDNQIIKVNGIFDKKLLDSLVKKPKPNYIIPKDVLVIDNIQKTN